MREDALPVFTTDFHTHILPGIDDGAANAEESLALLEMLHRQGIRRVALTPHFYADQDSPERFLARRQEAMDRLRQAIGGREDLPQLRCGAEVHYFPGMGQCQQLRGLTLEDTAYILVELPGAPWPEHVYRDLEQLHSQLGLTPIIAHIDRYISPLRTYGIPQRLAQLPVLVQANIRFFLRPTTGFQAIKLLRDGRIHLLGSDCHNLTTRIPQFDLAEQRIAPKLTSAQRRKLLSIQDQVWTGGI